MADKRLYILRHAKAEQDGGQKEDHARELAPRGRKNAVTMGEYMAGKGYRPGYCLCSTAERTRQTVAQLQKGMGFEIPTAFKKQLYLASAGDIYRQINQYEGEEDLLVIGHNPGMHLFCMNLADTPSGAVFEELQIKFPTAALAVFDVTEPWSALEPGKGHLIDFKVPRSL